MRKGELNQELFEQLTNALFTLHLNQTDEVELVLMEVKPLSPPKAANFWETSQNARQQPFSLIFCDASKRPLPQRLYSLVHQKSNTQYDLFLVPVGENENGRYYEALIN